MSEPELAGIPDEHLEPPPIVHRLAGGDTIRAVWQNQVGGLTFRLDSPSGDIRYVKWQATGTPEADLADEATRLTWAARWTAVPTVLETGLDPDGSWLVTVGIEAESAVDDRWMDHPETAVRAIGRGLRQLHDEIPVDDCPFDWSIERRLSQVDALIAGGMTPDGWFPEHRSLSLAEARERLGRPPSIDKLVVCHGDACAPNTLLSANGEYAAHVDLGTLGVADRWADVAVAAWSTEWNYGPGFTELLYESYGIEPDVDRIAYYRLLWDLS